jgi:peptidoglycan/LPS O-acetylase OafA/YrhL
MFGAFYLARHMETPTWLVKLGGWSYAMYLAHSIVSEVLAPLKAEAPILFMVANLTTVLAVSWVVHKFIELRSVEVGRKLTQKRTSAPAVS